MKVTREKKLGEVLVQEIRSRTGLRMTRVTSPRGETNLPVAFGTLCKVLEATFAAGRHELEEYQREQRAGDDW